MRLIIELIDDPNQCYNQSHPSTIYLNLKRVCPGYNGYNGYNG